MGRRSDGLGSLRDDAQRGLYVHPTYAGSTDREPSQVLDACRRAREPKDGTRGRPRESKASTRGVDRQERLAELASGLPDTRLVYVADRECDTIERMCRAGELDTPADWLRRAEHNRALPDGQKLWQTVTSGEELAGISFTLPARNGRQARVVRQQLWTRVIDLRHGKKQTSRSTGVVAKEIDLPAGSTRVECFPCYPTHWPESKQLCWHGCAAKRGPEYASQEAGTWKGHQRCGLVVRRLVYEDGKQARRGRRHARDRARIDRRPRRWASIATIMRACYASSFFSRLPLRMLIEQTAGHCVHIEYRHDAVVSVEQAIALYVRSTLGERRPVDRPDIFAGMLRNASLLITAWHAERLVGIARSLTDCTYVAYLADLAVDTEYQRRGIGARLIAETKRRLQPECMLVLLAAPKANDYYPKVGFVHHPRAWVLPGE